MLLSRVIRTEITRPFVINKHTGLSEKSIRINKRQGRGDL